MGLGFACASFVRYRVGKKLDIEKNLNVPGALALGTVIALFVLIRLLFFVKFATLLELHA